jgi:hypothetical protein
MAEDRHKSSSRRSKYSCDPLKRSSESEPLLKRFFSHKIVYLIFFAPVLKHSADPYRRHVRGSSTGFESFILTSSSM